MNTRLKYLLAAALLAGMSLSAHATITFTTIGGDEIFSDNGVTAAPTNSLVLLVADTTGAGFFNLNAGSAVTVGSTINTAGNDLVVGQLSLFTSGILDYSGTLSLSGGWTTGDKLAIYWIPTLTTSSTMVGSGVAYGEYTDGTGVGGSAAWITPADGTTAYPAMYFQTSNDGFFAGPPAPGAFAANDGYANKVTAVPEPSMYALFGGLLALSAAAWRRRKIG
jgi:hypothetical protein